MENLSEVINAKRLDEETSVTVTDDITINNGESVERCIKNLLYETIASLASCEEIANDIDSYCDNKKELDKVSSEHGNDSISNDVTDFPVILDINEVKCKVLKVHLVDLKHTHPDVVAPVARTMYEEKRTLKVSLVNLAYAHRDIYREIQFNNGVLRWNKRTARIMTLLGSDTNTQVHNNINKAGYPSSGNNPTSSNGLYRHIQPRTRRDKCDLQRNLRVNLVSGISSHQEKHQHQCDICSFQGSSVISLNRHKISSHITGVKTFSCKYCSARYTSSTSLRSHMHYMHRHSSEKELKCDVCNFRCLYMAHMKRHLLTHTGEKSFVCDLCSSSFARSDILKVHMLSHSNICSYSCKICGEKFRYNGSYIDHMRRHRGEKNHVCTVCDARFLRSVALKEHMRTHSIDKPFHCQHCDYRCRLGYSLNVHMRVHTGDKPYKCELCEKCYSQYGGLQRHTVQKHTGVKQFKCSEAGCDYATNRRDYIKVHERKHNGLKPYSCSVGDCLYKTTALPSLLLHLRTHTGDRPYKCHLCDYKSTNSSALRVHMRQHTGENPFKCTFCDYSSKQKNMLRMHLKKHG